MQSLTIPIEGNLNLNDLTPSFVKVILSHIKKNSPSAACLAQTCRRLKDVMQQMGHTLDKLDVKHLDNCTVGWLRNNGLLPKKDLNACKMTLVYKLQTHVAALDDVNGMRWIFGQLDILPVIKYSSIDVAMTAPHMPIPIPPNLFGFQSSVRMINLFFDSQLSWRSARDCRQEKLNNAIIHGRLDVLQFHQSDKNVCWVDLVGLCFAAGTIAIFEWLLSQLPLKNMQTIPLLLEQRVKIDKDAQHCYSYLPLQAAYDRGIIGNGFLKDAFDDLVTIQAWPAVEYILSLGSEASIKVTARHLRDVLVNNQLNLFFVLWLRWDVRNHTKVRIRYIVGVFMTVCSVDTIDVVSYLVRYHMRHLTLKSLERAFELLSSKHMSLTADHLLILEQIEDINSLFGHMLDHSQVCLDILTNPNLSAQICPKNVDKLFSTCCYNMSFNFAAQLLNDHRSKIDLEEALIGICVRGKEEALNWLVTYASVNVDCQDGAPMHAAVQMHRPTMVEMLYNLGAKRFLRDGGQAVIMTAVQSEIGPASTTLHVLHQVCGARASDPFLILSECLLSLARGTIWTYGPDAETIRYLIDFYEVSLLQSNSPGIEQMLSKTLQVLAHADNHARELFCNGPWAVMFAQARHGTTTFLETFVTICGLFCAGNVNPILVQDFTTFVFNQNASEKAQLSALLLNSIKGGSFMRAKGTAAFAYLEALVKCQ